MNHRFPRFLGAFVFAISLSASGLVGTALAANPAGWSGSVDLLPSTVSYGQAAGYRVNFSNAGPSNISQLYLTATTPDRATFVSADPSQGFCNTTGPLWCNLGALNAGSSLNVLVIYTVPSSGTSMPITFEFNTTGIPGGKNQSHGDAKQLPVSTALIASTQDFFGRFAYTPDLLTVFDDQALSNLNKQSTLVNGPGGHGPIPITVGEVAYGSGSLACPAFANRKCFGQWSEMHVNNGQTFDEGFTAVVGFSSFELPNNKDAGNIRIIHVSDAGVAAEVLRCSTPTPTASQMPCFTAVDSGDDVIATLFLLENGRTGGY